MVKSFRFRLSAEGVVFIIFIAIALAALVVEMRFQRRRVDVREPERRGERHIILPLGRYGIFTLPDRKR